MHINVPPQRYAPQIVADIAATIWRDDVLHMRQVNDQNVYGGNIKFDDVGTVIVEGGPEKIFIPIVVPPDVFWKVQFGRDYAGHISGTLASTIAGDNAFIAVTSALHDALKTDNALTSLAVAVVEHEVGHYILKHHIQPPAKWALTTESEDVWSEISTSGDANLVYTTISDGLLRGGVVRAELAADLAALELESTDRHAYLRMLAYQADSAWCSLAERMELTNRILWHLTHEPDVPAQRTCIIVYVKSPSVRECQG